MKPQLIEFVGGPWDGKRDECRDAESVIRMPFVAGLGSPLTWHTYVARPEAAGAEVWRFCYQAEPGK